MRDFHCLDYAFGGNIFKGDWIKRILTKNEATDRPGWTNYNIYDRFTHGKRVAAQRIPLDIPSLRLDAKARFDLTNLPWSRITLLGGNIAIHGPRRKENEIINQSRLAYSDGRPGMKNVDQKIMWKMYDRERDYNWIKLHRLQVLLLMSEM